MENIIKINKLGYNYGEGWILHDLSVEIAQGDFVAVIGPNGAGKSTLLRLLAGILQPTSGEIELYGTPLPQFKAWEKSVMYRRILLNSIAISQSVSKRLSVWAFCVAAVCFRKFPGLAKPEWKRCWNGFIFKSLRIVK